MGTVYIYALAEPDLWQEIRYIGASKNPQKRLRDHVAPSHHICNPQKTQWFKALREQKLKPILRILEAVDEDAWEDAERKWIGFYRSQGANLTNVTPGGHKGYTMGRKPARQRDNRQVAALKRWANPEFRAKRTGIALPSTTRQRMSIAATKRHQRDREARKQK